MHQPLPHGWEVKRSKSDPKKSYYCSTLEVDPKNPARALTQWERPKFRVKTVADLNNLKAKMPPGWVMEERPRLPARQQYGGRGRPAVSEPTAAELGGVPVEDRVLLFLNSAADIAELNAPAFDPIANKLSVAWPGYESTYTGKEFERLLLGLLSWDPAGRYHAMSEMRALYASTEASSRLTQGGSRPSPPNTAQWLAETRAGDAAAAAHAVPERPNPRAVQPRSLNSTLAGDERDEASASASASGLESGASSDWSKSAAKRTVNSFDRTDSSVDEEPNPAAAAAPDRTVAGAVAATRSSRRKSRGRSSSGSSDGGAEDEEGQEQRQGQAAGAGLGKRRARAQSGERNEKASIFDDGWEGDAGVGVGVGVGAELARRPVVNMAEYIHRQGFIAANSKDFATGWEGHPELHFEIIKLFNSRPRSADDPTPGQKFTLRFDKVYPQNWNARLFGTGTGRRSKDFNSNDEEARLKMGQKGNLASASALLRICRVSDAAAREMEWECEALLQDSDVTIFFDDLQDDSSDNENDDRTLGWKRRRHADAEEQGDETASASASALGDLGGSSGLARHKRPNADAENQPAPGSKRKQRSARGGEKSASAGGGSGDPSDSGEIGGGRRRLRSSGLKAP